MAVAADGQARVRPVGADAAHQAPDMTADLGAGRGLAGPQQDGHRACGCRVIDVDGHEAAFVVMRVEQRELLVAVHDVHGVINIERYRLGRPGVAGAVGVDHGVAQAHDLAQRRRVFPARDGRLRAQVATAVRQAAAGELEAGIGAQVVEVVGVLVAAGDGEHAGTQDIGDAVGHEGRVARIGNQRGQPVGNAKATLGGGQEHDAAIGGEPAPVEGGE